jgi:hypothetical protein
LSFDPRAIEIRLNTSSMYARTIASAASPGKPASIDDLIRAESLQIVAFLLGPTGGGEGRYKSCEATRKANGHSRP